MSITKPKAIIFDLDDTLILSEGTIQKTWQEICKSYKKRHPAVDTEELYKKIREIAIWFWSDKTRHREGRNDMDKTRREIALKAFEQMGLDDSKGAIKMADEFSERRYEMLELFPGSLEILETVRQAEIKTGLLTNGEAKMQRRKIDQFQLVPYFDVIQVEGEAGIGKPEPESYRMIMKRLGVTASEAWIVGDNLEWEVVVPQQIGLTAIWLNFYQKSIPNPDIKPDRILTEISQLAEVLAESLSN